MYGSDFNSLVGSVPGYGVAEVLDGKMDGHAVFPYFNDETFLIVRGRRKYKLDVVLIELKKFLEIGDLLKSDPQNRLFTACSVIVVGTMPPMETELSPTAKRSPRVERIRRIKSVCLDRGVFERAVEFYGSPQTKQDSACESELELVIVKMPSLVAGASSSKQNSRKPARKGFGS